MVVLTACLPVLLAVQLQTTYLEICFVHSKDSLIGASTAFWTASHCI